MNRLFLAPLILIPAAALLSGCGGAKIKQAQDRMAACEIAHGKTRAELIEAKTQAANFGGEKAEIEDKLAEASSNLKSAESRIAGLMKSNKDLSSTMQSSQGELLTKVKRLVGEKDELGRKLADVHKDKAAVERKFSRLYLNAEKLAKGLEAAKKELEDLSQEAAASGATREAAAREQAERKAKFKEETDTLVDAVAKEMRADQAEAADDGNSFRLTLREALLFKEGDGKLLDSGAMLLDRLGRALQAMPERSVRVEGHSDNSPLKWELFGGFGNQWQLSSARATAVARYLHEHGGLDPRRLVAVGYGEFRPVEGNDTPEGRKANRRVVLVVEP